MRKNIFDIASENITMKSEAERLVYLATKEITLRIHSYDNETLFQYVNHYRFDQWKQRGHFLNLQDFLKGIDYEGVKKKAANDVESLLTLIEIIYNIWMLAYKAFDDMGKNHSLEYYESYYHLKEIMDDLLKQYNYTVYIDEKNEQVLVIEDNPAVTATAEIVDAPLATEIIRYNHHALKGEIDLKKEILLKMALNLEPQRKELKALDSKLEDNIFFMFNNLDLRHNNHSMKDKNYKEYVAKMDKEALENWYDELYQMVLLAFLLLDNVERTGKVKELKGKIAGGTN